MDEFTRWLQINGVRPSRMVEWPTWPSNIRQRAEYLAALADGEPVPEYDRLLIEELVRLSYPAGFTDYGGLEWVRADRSIERVPGVRGWIGGYPPNFARQNSPQWFENITIWLDAELDFSPDVEFENDGRGNDIITFEVWIPLTDEWHNRGSFRSATQRMDPRILLAGLAVLQEDILATTPGITLRPSYEQALVQDWSSVRSAPTKSQALQRPAITARLWAAFNNLLTESDIPRMRLQTDDEAFISRRFLSWWMSRVQERLAFVWPRRTKDVSGRMPNEPDTVRFVDRKMPEIMAALSRADIYKKHGRVRARRAIPGEVVTTTHVDGTTETVNTAGKDEWVVTNPSGEQYIIPDSKFISRYEATGEEGVYAAKGYCRAFPNPFGEPIKIMAAWGSIQIGDERCLIADVCDASGNGEGEPYLIDADAFAKTYRPARQVRGRLTKSSRTRRQNTQGAREPRDLGPDFRIHAEGGSTRLPSDWLPHPRTTVHAPEVEGFVYLGEHTFPCFNDEEGLKVFTVPVYRNILFARAAQVRLDAPIQDRPNARMLTADTEFVLLPMGHHASFLMGSSKHDRQARDDEKPQHEVRFEHRFLIARTPATQRIWAYLSPDLREGGRPNPSYFAADDVDNPLDPATERPVEMVNWNDCVQWCDGQGLRLPSEAEWEFSCRAGTKTRYFFGNNPNRLTNFAWYEANAGGTTHPVATLAANAFGLFDMSGNVFEWCGDEWHDNYKGAPADGSVWGVEADVTYRVFRGSCWGNRESDCRSAGRRYRGPLDCYSYLGFRPALTVVGF